MHFLKLLFSPPENGVPVHTAGVVGTQTCSIACVPRPARSARPVTMPWSFCDLSHSRPQTHQKPVESPRQSHPNRAQCFQLVLNVRICVPATVCPSSTGRLLKSGLGEPACAQPAHGAVAECCPALGLLVGLAFPTGSALLGEGVSWSLLPYLSCFVAGNLPPSLSDGAPTPPAFCGFLGARAVLLRPGQVSPLGTSGAAIAMVLGKRWLR